MFRLPPGRPLLERLNIDSENWLYNTQHFESQYNGLMDTALSIKAQYLKFGLQIQAINS